MTSKKFFDSFSSHKAKCTKFLSVHISFQTGIFIIRPSFFSSHFFLVVDENLATWTLSLAFER